MRVCYKQQVGEEKDIPGGAVQGAPLGLWIFLFINDSAGPKPMNQSKGTIITQPMSINQRKKIKRTKKNRIDDFSLLSSIDLKKTLLANTEPVPYRSRTEHTLPR